MGRPVPASARPATTVKPAIGRVGWASAMGAGALVALIRFLPGRALRGLAWAVGRSAYVLRIRRRVALDNLAHAFPEKSEAERKRIAQGAYVNMALAALEAVSATGLTDRALESTVVLENWASVEAAIAAGKGVLVASGHFGSWELFADVMARRGYPLNAVVRPLTGALNARIVEARRRSGVRLILQRGALREMLAALRRGEVVAQLVDQALPSKSALWVPFFGRPASTTPALSTAALRTGAPVFVMLAAREGARLRVYAEGPIPMPDTGDRRQDVILHATRVTEVVERYVRRYPEQWLWLHRRWKQPTG